MKKLSDRDLVAKEYATIDRLAMRRLDRTAWLGGESEPWLLALAAIAEARPTRVLDAGCGAGDFAALLTAPDVRCVDLSPAAIDAARANGLRAEVADIQNLPFPDGSFDVTVANWVLYHVPDRGRAIAELARVLTPTGRFVGCYNAPGHLQELWSRVGATVDADDFNSDNGPAELQQSFRQVQVREAHGEVLWETRERVQTYLDAYHEMYGSLTAPDGPYPLLRPGETSFSSPIDEPPAQPAQMRARKAPVSRPSDRTLVASRHGHGRLERVRRRLPAGPPVVGLAGRGRGVAPGGDGAVARPE